MVFMTIESTLGVLSIALGDKRVILQFNASNSRKLREML